MRSEATNMASEARARTRFGVAQFARQVRLGVAVLVLLSLVFALAACSSRPAPVTPIPTVDLEPTPTLTEAADLVLTLAQGVKLELVKVPAGEFIMGSAAEASAAQPQEKPQHTVYLDEYLVGRYEVTVAQYRAYVETSRGTTDTGGNLERDPDYPIEHVSWRDATAFCEWASEVTEREVRLCTEAEWEKAARGTDGRIYPWGDAKPTAELCNFDGNVRDLVAVGQYSPAGDSPYGCADMAGNAYEWVNDWWDRDYYADSPGSNPTGPTDPVMDDALYPGLEIRVLRSGGFSYGADYMRAALRYLHLPSTRSPDGADPFGFRVCVSPITSGS